MSVGGLGLFPVFDGKYIKREIKTNVYGEMILIPPASPESAEQKDRAACPLCPLCTLRVPLCPKILLIVLINYICVYLRASAAKFLYYLSLIHISEPTRL